MNPEGHIKGKNDPDWWSYTYLIMMIMTLCSAEEVAAEFWC